MQKHGGFVRVDTELGLGSVFSVFLPATAGEAPVLPQASAPPAQAGNGELILLVDDEAAIRDDAQLAELGVAEILVKPIQVETLLKAIRMQLSARG